MRCCHKVLYGARQLRKVQQRKGRIAKLSIKEVDEGTDLPDATTIQDNGKIVVTKKRKLDKDKGLSNHSAPPEVQVQDSQPVRTGPQRTTQ